MSCLADSGYSTIMLIFHAMVRNLANDRDRLTKGL